MKKTLKRKKGTLITRGGSDMARIFTEMDDKTLTKILNRVHEEFAEMMEIFRIIIREKKGLDKVEVKELEDAMRVFDGEITIREALGLLTDEDLITILDRDIDDTRYAPLCFRKLWELPNGFSNGIKYLNRLLQNSKKDSSMDIKGALKRFFEAMGDNKFKEFLPEMLKILEEENYYIFYGIVRVIGFLDDSEVINIFNRKDQELMTESLRSPELYTLPILERR